MKHLFLDFETLSDKSYEAISVNCAYVIIDDEKDYTFEELVKLMQFAKFDTREQKNIGFKTSKDTIKFWKSLPPEVMSQIVPSSDDMTLEQFVKEFSEYIKANGKPDRWWSRGNNFDPVLLQRIFDQTNTPLHKVLHYGKIRDIRTYLDAMVDFNKDFDDGFTPPDCQDIDFKKHDCKHDVAMDVMRFLYFRKD